VYRSASICDEQHQQLATLEDNEDDTASSSIYSLTETLIAELKKSLEIIVDILYSIYNYYCTYIQYFDEVMRFVLKY
jgi:hypothetical protein